MTPWGSLIGVGPRAALRRPPTLAECATHRVYRPDERPDIEVLVDGVWCEGELRMWTRAARGRLVAGRRPVAAERGADATARHVRCESDTSRVAKRPILGPREVDLPRVAR